MVAAIRLEDGLLAESSKVPTYVAPWGPSRSPSSEMISWRAAPSPKNAPAMAITKIRSGANEKIV